MNQKPNHPINHANARLLCEDDFGSKIYRTSLDHYAITGIAGEDPVFCFESKAFSRILACFGSAIADFNLVRLTSMLFENPKEFYEFAVIMKNGHAFRFNENGEIESMTGINLEPPEDPPASPATALWDIGRAFPFDRMMISKVLASELSPYSNDLPIEQILGTMWEEANATYPDRSLSEMYPVFGYILKYHAVELACGRFVFLSRLEAESFDASDLN